MERPSVSESGYQYTAIFAVDRFTSREALALYYQRSKVHIPFNMFQPFRWSSSIANYIGRMKHIQLEIFSPMFTWSECPPWNLDRHDRRLAKLIEDIKIQALSLQTFQLSILTPEWPDRSNQADEPTTILVENGFTAHALQTLCQHISELTIIGIGRKETLGCLRHSMAPESAWSIIDIQSWPHPWPDCARIYRDKRIGEDFHIRAWSATKFQAAKMETSLLKKAGRIMVVGGKSIELDGVDWRYW